MLVLQNDKVAMTDIDDTLIIWSHTAKRLGIEDRFVQEAREFSLNGVASLSGMPNLEMIEFLHNLKAQGITLVAWSHAGYAWADYILKELQIDHLFDVVLTKPYLLLDDKPVEHLGTNTWIGPSKVT